MNKEIYIGFLRALSVIDEKKLIGKYVKDDCNRAAVIRDTYENGFKIERKDGSGFEHIGTAMFFLKYEIVNPDFLTKELREVLEDAKND